MTTSVLDSLKRGSRKALEKTLREGEALVAAWPVASGALVCAKERILIVKHVMPGTTAQVNSYRYEDITSVHVNWGARFFSRSTTIELSVPGFAASPTSTVDHAGPTDTWRAMMAPNVVAFIGGEKQRLAAREALETIERLRARSRRA